MSDPVKHGSIVQALIDAGAAKARLSTLELLIRSGLAGAILGVAETLLFTATVQTGVPLIGALVFPVGFAMIVLLGLDLVTGSFAVLPLAVLAGRATVGQMLINWITTFIGNFMGALILACLMYVVLTNAGHNDGGMIADRIRVASVARSLGYGAMGISGFIVVFAKAMLCHWMVCLGVVMAAAASTLGGKVLGCWLPIFVFVAQGFEHAVVNMSLFPLGILLGAKTTFLQFVSFNELPVTLGNLVGGFLFTGLALYVAYSTSISEQRGV
jgi:formate/nitrite transporter